MNKRELIRAAVDLLQNNNIKKPISIPRQSFHISDDEGNSKTFSVKKTDKSVLYTISDVENILNAFICVIQDSIKQGDPVLITGFGSLGLNYRAPRKTKDIRTGEEINIDGRYVPKFSPGVDLKMCAKLYELSVKDKLAVAAALQSEEDMEGGD